MNKRLMIDSYLCSMLRMLNYVIRLSAEHITNVKITISFSYDTNNSASQRDYSPFDNNIIKLVKCRVDIYFRHYSFLKDLNF